MADLRQAAQMALRELLDVKRQHAYTQGVPDAIDALRAALSAQQEPVGHVAGGGDIAYGVVKWCVRQGPPLRIGEPLYTHPAPTAQPLTDEPLNLPDQIKRFLSDDETLSLDEYGVVLTAAELIERAHGIGG